MVKQVHRSEALLAQIKYTAVFQGILYFLVLLRIRTNFIPAAVSG